MSVNIDAIDQHARDLAQMALSNGNSHEALCEERWQQQKIGMILVQKTVDEIKKGMENSIGRMPAGIIAALTGLVGWLAARAFPLH